MRKYDTAERWNIVALIRLRNFNTAEEWDIVSVIWLINENTAVPLVYRNGD